MLSKGTDMDWEHLRGLHNYCSAQTDLVLADRKFDDFLLSNHAIEDYMQEFNIKKEIISFNDKDAGNLLRKSKGEMGERFSMFNAPSTNDRSPTLKKPSRLSNANNNESNKGGGNNRKSILTYLEQISRPVKRKTNLIGEEVEVKEEENESEESAPKQPVSKERFSMALKKTFGIDLDSIIKKDADEVIIYLLDK